MNTIHNQNGIICDMSGGKHAINRKNKSIVLLKNRRHSTRYLPNIHAEFHSQQKKPFKSLGNVRSKEQHIARRRNRNDMNAGRLQPRYKVAYTLRVYTVVHIQRKCL